jgi:glycosyltransferase involved in cell wall biosynthesis
MNVLYVTTQDLRKPGGARSHVLGFCKALTNLGASLRIMSPYGTEPLSQKRSFRNRADHLLKVLHMRSGILDSLRSGWPDVAYFRKGFLDPGLFCALRVRKPKVFVEINGMLKEESYNTLRYAAAKASGAADEAKYLGADLVVAVSQGLRDDLLAKYGRLDPEKVIVVINGVDTDVFFPRDRRECREALSLPQDAFIAVFCGKAAERHGLHVALRAMKRLKTKHGDRVRLCIVGDGPALNEVKRSVKSSGLDHTVHCVGMQTQDRVAQFIGASDLCLSPHSAWPTNRIGVSPLKLFEYLACHRPVLCSDVKGIDNVISETSAGAVIGLVPPDDDASLARAVEGFMNREIPEGAWSKIREKASWSARAGQVFEHMK